MEAFVHDPAPDAYEKLVDKFMHAPAWGEHRARYWLDAARYADTHGLHFDNYREMWAYRDWVIDAFNRNLRFDQFGIEQLAGDLLPNPTLDQLVATGFNRCNMTTNEGGTILEENLVMYTRDRTETVAQVFLGLTANCATCHDHKFDPITTRDFYSLSAFFNNSTQGALDGNIRDTPPIIFVPRREDRARWDKLAHDIKEMKTTIDARKQAARPSFDKWLATATPALAAELVPTQGLTLTAPLNEGTGETLHLTVAGKPKEVKLSAAPAWVAGKVTPKAYALKAGVSAALPEVGDFERNQGFSVGTWLRLGKRGMNGALAARMDNTSGHRGWDVWLENERVAMHIINRWPENALKVTAKTPLKPAQWHHVLVTYDGSSKASGVKIFIDGVAQAVDVFTDKLTETIRTPVPFKIGQRHGGEGLPAGAVQDLRVYERTLDGAEAEQLAKGSLVQASLAKAAKDRTAGETADIFAWWLATLDAPTRALNAGFTGLQKEESVMRARGTNTFIVQERPQAPVAYVLYRGQYDQRRDKVGATTPKSLPPLPAKAPHNRLGFAGWLFAPEQPLTARVTVNRFWQEIFGTGLVRTAGDFGIMGEVPSHPELLDWLAVDFRESGWNVRRFFKQLVTSATYRQAATVSPEGLEKDPHNRLLAHGPRGAWTPR